MEQNQKSLLENILYFRYYPAIDLFLLNLKNQTPLPYRCSDSFKFYAELKAKGIKEA